MFSTAKLTATNLTAPKPAAANLTHTLLRAEGFSCPSCVAKIEKRLGRLDGVADVKVHFATSRIEVDHDSTRVGVEELVEQVGKAGYVAKPAAF